MNRRSAILGYVVLIMLVSAGGAHSLSGSNTVFGDDIVDGTITTPDLKTGALSGSKILDNAVTGADVNESTLVLTCPTGLTRTRDVCYQPTLGNGTFTEALDSCLAQGLRLPSVAEARLVAIHVNQSSQIWTDVVYDDDGAPEATTVNNDTDIFFSGVASGEDYYCVTTVGARPLIN